MSELYLIFFSVGLVLFAAIVGFSVYQQGRQVKKPGAVYSKKTAKKTKKVFKETPRKEVELSFDDEEVEDSEAHLQSYDLKPDVVDERLADTPTVGDAQSPLESDGIEGSSAEVTGSKIDAEPKVSATVHQAEMAPRPKLDKDSSSIVTELVARVKNSEPLEQQNLLSIFRTHDFNFHRKVHIYGLNQLTDMWRDIEFELPSARFVELGISIQLADRDGAMSQKELHDFQQMVLEFTDTFDAPFEFSMDIDDALKQALALDQIGRRYDSMAVLNVIPKSKAGFRLADIESCARDLMMSTDKNGIFMKTSGQRNNITVHFRLACTDDSGQFGISNGAAVPVHDLVLYMNVPATKDPEKVFQDMVKDANSLATWLGGMVVDRNGRRMSQRAYSTLMQQVSDITFSMQQDGFTPGDAVSKKIF